VPLNVGELELKELFSKYGTIRSIKVKKPQIWSPNVQMSGSSTSYGIAYVDFFKEEDAQKAMKELNGYQIGANRLSIDYYQKQSYNPGDVFDN